MEFYKIIFYLLLHFLNNFLNIYYFRFGENDNFLLIFLNFILLFILFNLFIGCKISENIKKLKLIYVKK